MPRAAKVCARADCPHTVPCPVHPAEPFKGSTRRSRLPKDWSRRRAKVLKRDPFCMVCRVSESTEVDHIEAGDNHSLLNLQGICNTCHKTKTAKEGNAARNHR